MRNSIKCDIKEIWKGSGLVFFNSYLGVTEILIICCNADTFDVSSRIYRVYTKEWCGFPLCTIETAPLFCVYPVLYN
jgi:hypothetical protein